jgi:hypothetical protein
MISYRLVLWFYLLVCCNQGDSKASLDQAFVKDINEMIQVFKDTIRNKMDLSKTDQTKISDYTVKYAETKKGLKYDV